MRNIPKKGWSTWGIVILTLLLNIVIINIVNNKQDFLWLLIISVALFTLAIFNTITFNRSFLSFVKSLGSRTQYPTIEVSSHSIYPKQIKEDDLSVLIGNDQCSKPCSISLLSIDPWKNNNDSFAHPELHVNEFKNPARVKSDFSDTFNSSTIGPTWQIDASYQGCRAENGNFDNLAFKKIASLPQVKMIEINLNSSVIRNREDSSVGITKSFGRKESQDLFTCSGYTTFHNAEGLVHFVENLRNLSNGKPVGIRFSLNDKKDFQKICHAIRKTQIVPDFIVISGSQGKIAFNESDLHFYSEMPLYDALLFVAQTLQSYGLNDIKLIAIGKIMSGFDILKMLALGADSVCADSTHFSLSENDHKPKVNSQYMGNELYHRLMNELVQIMNDGEFLSLKDITIPKFLRRLDVSRSTEYAQIEEKGLHAGSVRKIMYDKPTLKKQTVKYRIEEFGK